MLTTASQFAVFIVHSASQSSIIIHQSMDQWPSLFSSIFYLWILSASLCFHIVLFHLETLNEFSERTVG